MAWRGERMSPLQSPQNPQNSEARAREPAPERSWWGERMTPPSESPEPPSSTSGRPQRTRRLLSHLRQDYDLGTTRPEGGKSVKGSTSGSSPQAS